MQAEDGIRGLVRSRGLGDVYKRQAADRFEGVGIDKHVRAWEKPSDHVPVWVSLRAVSYTHLTLPTTYPV